MATFNERRAPTSRKYAAKQGVVIPNWSKIVQIFRSYSFVFALEIQAKNIIFQSYFISNRPFAGYFQWKGCTDFQKICHPTKYSDAKLIKNNSNFWVALLRFCYRKTMEKSKCSESFLPLIGSLVAPLNKTRAPTPRKYLAKKGIVMPNWSKTFQTFWLRSSTFSEFFTSNKPFGGYFQ